MKRSHVAASSVITAISLQGPWLKLIQARLTGEGVPTLLGLKARKVEERTEEALVHALKDLIRTVPIAPKDILGLLSKGEILTRYLTLPSSDPEELRTMALYQLEGVLPLPIHECVTSVKILGPVGEATRVLVAAVLRPSVEQMVRLCQRAGLNLTQIAVSSEAIGCWHQACWPKSEGPLPDVWLAADVTNEGLDIGVLVKGSPVYMRQVLHLTGSVEELIAQLHETLQAYAKERIGPPVEQVTLSGWFEGLGPVPLERLEAALELPIRRVDPLESSPFRESLSITAQEFSTEVSFSELLGAVCAPRLLKLDLLPLETRLKQAKQKLLLVLRQTALLILVGTVLLFGWVGTKIGGTWWRTRQTKAQIDLLEPQAGRIKEMAATIQRIAAAQQNYAVRLKLLSQAATCLLPAMNLQFLNLDKDRALTLRGTAPSFETVTSYAAALHSQKLWRNVLLRSVKTQGENLSSVEFEMFLQPLEKEGRQGKGE